MSENSPFHAVHQQLNANFADFDGCTLPANFGDITAETNALTASSAAFDLTTFARITIKGPSSETFLTTLTGQPCPAQDTWIWAKISNNPIRIAKIEDFWQIFTPPKSAKIILAELENAPADVKIIDNTPKTAMLALYGPTAFQSIKNILPFDMPELSGNSITKISFFMMNITIIRGSWIGCDGLELLCPKGAAGMAAGAIAKYKDKENIVPAGMECLKAAIESSDCPLATI
jgi:glycine cleavage system aminomethyltransferase T